MAVYFIQDEVVCLIKIGVASDPLARLRDLQTGSPAKLILLASVEGGRDEERSLHSLFDAYRAHGEWFRPGPRLLKYLMGLGDRGAKVPIGPPAPHSAPPRKLDSRYREGQVVLHPEHGRGVIIRLTDGFHKPGNEANAAVTIQFAEARRRTFMATRLALQFPEALSV